MRFNVALTLGRPWPGVGITHLLESGGLAGVVPKVLWGLAGVAPTVLQPKNGFSMSAIGVRFVEHCTCYIITNTGCHIKMTT